jgi:hypothetical protein
MSLWMLVLATLPGLSTGLKLQSVRSGYLYGALRISSALWMVRGSTITLIVTRSGPCSGRYLSSLLVGLHLTRRGQFRSPRWLACSFAIDPPGRMAVRSPWTRAVCLSDILMRSTQLATKPPLVLYFPRHSFSIKDACQRIEGGHQPSDFQSVEREPKSPGLNKGIGKYSIRSASGQGSWMVLYS